MVLSEGEEVVDEVGSERRRVLFQSEEEEKVVARGNKKGGSTHLFIWKENLGSPTKLRTPMREVKEGVRESVLRVKFFQKKTHLGLNNLLKVLDR
jgi:hypothetical protein